MITNSSPRGPSLAQRIAEALEAAGADRRAVSYFWSFHQTVSGDDFRNDAKVIAAAGFGIGLDGPGTRSFRQRDNDLLALLPADLQATLVGASFVGCDGGSEKRPLVGESLQVTPPAASPGGEPPDPLSDTEHVAPEPIPWRVWWQGSVPSQSRTFVEREALRVAERWADVQGWPWEPTIVFVERAEIEPLGSRALEYQVWKDVAGGKQVRHVGPLWWTVIPPPPQSAAPPTLRRSLAMGSNRSRRSRSKIHAEAKASPPAQQARRDALVQLRGGEIVDVVLARDAAALGRFVRVRPLEEEDGLVVLAMKRGRQTLGSARGHLRQVRPDKILGVVLRMDGRSPHQGQDGQGRAEGSSSSADTSAELDPRQLLLFSAESDPPK